MYLKSLLNTFVTFFGLVKVKEEETSRPRLPAVTAGGRGPRVFRALAAYNTHVRTHDEADVVYAVDVLYAVTSLRSASAPGFRKISRSQ